MRPGHFLWPLDARQAASSSPADDATVYQIACWKRDVEGSFPVRRPLDESVVSSIVEWRAKACVSFGWAPLRASAVRIWWGGARTSKNGPPESRCGMPADSRSSAILPAAHRSPLEDGRSPLRLRHPAHVLPRKGLETAGQTTCLEAPHSAQYHGYMTRIYEEIVDFIAQGTTPAKLAEFSPSQETKDRVADLIHREKTSKLSEEESSELNHYLEFEHIMRLAKARARTHLSNE